MAVSRLLRSIVWWACQTCEMGVLRGEPRACETVRILNVSTGDVSYPDLCGRGYAC
ncbi:hypothetical protein AA3266_1572 [Gluconobacter kondonii NBRC 3266]|nr:hypothetical protein AA3266_1572 [Gluconobacter kondonii NBRC 3266]